MIGTKNQIITYLLVQKEETKFELKEYKEKRGLQANKYYWTLINELANVLRMDKEDLHFKMLQSYGQHELISVLADIDLSNFIKYYVEAGESVLNGKTFKHYKVFKPSSEMDSKEFSILLDGLVQECKQQGIETLEDKEIEEMIKNYESTRK
jgi:hypothetical protein